MLLKLISMCMLIILLLSMMSLFFFSMEEENESSSLFECGIDPNNEIKSPFYMHFFYVGILFLVFDVELALTIPLIVSFLSEKVWNIFWFWFLFILLMGLIIEIFLGTLDWKE